MAGALSMADIPPGTVLEIVAAIVTDPAGRALLVRKRGTEAFLQPGGKIEPGEDPLDALVRELEEELGLVAARERFRFVGAFTAPAANEAGVTVDACVWALETDEKLGPRAEIEELLWIADLEDAAGRVIAPLSVEHLLPLWHSSRA